MQKTKKNMVIHYGYTDWQDGGNARLEAIRQEKTEDGLVQYNEEVNKLGDDLKGIVWKWGKYLAGSGMEHWR